VKPLNPIVRLEDAVHQLGVNAWRMLPYVIRFEVLRGLKSKALEFISNHFIGSCCLSACVARKFAEHTRIPKTLWSAIYDVGILHDLGMLSSIQ